MTHYIVKAFDATCRLVGRNHFSARNDDEAESAVADMLRRDLSQELWSGNRWIRTWPAAR